MKFLYISVKGTINDLMYGLNAMGHSLDYVNDCVFAKHGNEEEKLDMLDKQLSKNKYDYAISYMFSTDVSTVLQKHGVKYLSWIYDSPDPMLYSEEAEDDNNYIFVFDRMFYNHLKSERNIPHLFHLPLGSCISRINRININKNDIIKYPADVSFVGNLYEDNQFEILKKSLSRDELVLINSYVNNNCCSWHCARHWPSVSDEFLKTFEDNKYFDKALIFSMDKSIYLGISILTRKLANIERTLLLDELGKYENVRLYTKSDASSLANVNACPPVGYERDMSIVFNQTKINLNITIPSIESGIPLRVWDIIGSGGFCMTNYQPEIEEHFEIGKDIETFKDFDELRLKTRFYLEHEDLRLKILMNGYKKVIENHTYVHRISKMLQFCNS